MAKQYQRQDHLYERAKDEEYRSRAAYKLIELNKRFRLMPRGACVLDLGAWPGSWLQVAKKSVGEDGIVVGIDITPLEPMHDPGIHVLTRDATDPELCDDLLKISGRPFGVVLSDMSPKLTGIKELDRARIEVCANAALDIALRVLAPGGHFVVKLFQSPEADTFAKKATKAFARSTRVGLDATRRSSTEWYFVGQQLKGPS